jgi:hypothetical protein
MTPWNEDIFYLCINEESGVQKGWELEIHC